MIINIILIVICIMFSAVFSSSEIAYASSSRVKLRKAAEAGERGAKAAVGIAENFEKALITILIGNNLVNIASSAIATVIAIGLFGNSGAGIATAVMTVLIITFGEISPKLIASRMPEKFACFISPLIKLLIIITTPAVFVLNAFVGLVSRIWQKQAVEEIVTEDDLETIFETVEDEGVVDEDTADLLQSALDFDDVLAYEIITPRVDVEAIDIEDSTEEIKEQIMSTTYSRLPVYEDSVDNIIGICHVNFTLKALANGEKLDLRKLMMKPNFVHKTMPLDDVFEVMQNRDTHMVIVTDEYGGTMGILTMEDVLEQIVGDIWDEKDEIDEEFVELSPNLYEVDADMRIEDLFYELDMDEKDFDDDNATLGGWAIEMLAGYPQVGDSFEYKNLSFKVAETEGMRVTSLLVEFHPLPEEDED
ncbi:MAG: HlyC/CorC family transporter [Clostridiales bacterium]|nr:HlyC/CorC family transporter [Clostridiales bacterium]